MGTAKLTDRLIASLAAQGGQRQEIFDAQVPGLSVRVTDRGRKTFVVRYRTIDGRQPRFTLGTYPILGLADAREAANDVLRRVRLGEDPATDKRRAATTAKERPIKTFDDLAARYLTACERGEWTPKGKKKRPRTLADDRAVLKRYVQPAFGNRRLEEINRPTVKGLLREMAGRGIGAQTNRTQAFIRQVFAYAISEFDGELVSINPATGFSPLGQVQARTRVLTDPELKSLWQGLERSGGTAGQEDRPAGVRISRAMAIVIQLAILLLQRKSEIAGMRVDELNFAQSTWTIPGDRMKGGRTHIVPLPPHAAALVQEALGLRLAQASPCVFPSSRNDAVPLRGDSVTHAMAQLTDALILPNATVHDLRRTGATIMTSERLGITPFLVSRVLGHRSDTGGAAAVTMNHYALHEFTAERRRALESWEGLLLSIVGERAALPVEVVQLASRR